MKPMITAMMLVCAAAPTLVAQQPAAGAQDELRVTRAVVATGVEEREPVGVADAFPADVGRLVFYTVFEGDLDEAAAEHVWLFEGEEMARVPLTVRGPRWRTWSSKQILEHWVGSWTVQAIGPDGNVLESVEISVREARPTTMR